MKDWNNNGKRDAFDRMMDQKIASQHAAPPRSKSASPKEEQGSAIAPSIAFLITLLCVSGMVIPIMLDFGALGRAICLLGIVGIGVLLTKPTRS